ncbi:uncharacterized protein LOC130787583 [Actinidia eriantha]|uniref:uncharacterized protein LOC130787583 n=1 Tax=Actinidia eriantha TaxID=165200 RepID=UPI002585B192|nr:uncharacterized protein LOC130787583 [Actinidia eriantha]
MMIDGLIFSMGLRASLLVWLMQALSPTESVAAGGGTFSMEWWHKMTAPMRRFWIFVAKPLGIRKTGLVKLRHEVRTCEYEDVRVLWEMLKRNETELKTKKKHFWSMSTICDLARRTPYLCRSF